MMKVMIGMPQGGQKSPIMFRDFSNDILASTSNNLPSWKAGEVEDEMRRDVRPASKKSPITRNIESKGKKERLKDEA